MVVLENYASEQEAYLVAGMLQSNGIQAVVQDNDNLYVPVFGGVEVLVNEDDLARAKELISAHDDE